MTSRFIRIGVELAQDGCHGDSNNDGNDEISADEMSTQILRVAT